MAKSRRKGKSARAIKKAATPNSTSEQRRNKKQISSAAIEAVRYVVDTLKPFELSRSQRLKTYQSMLADDAIFSSIDSRQMAVEKAQAAGSFTYDINSPESVKLKEFLEYNMKALEGQTPRSIGRDSADMILNSWSPFEFVATTRPKSEFPDKFLLKKLAYIHPLSLDQAKPFHIKDGGNEIEYLRQSSAAFVGNDGKMPTTLRNWAGIKEIDYRNVMTVSYSGTQSQPMGTSPLDAAYTAWREKQLLQDYMLIGVTRDFSGTPVLRIPEDVLAAASADPTSPSAAQVNALADGMANMHSGDASYIILPSDAQAENGTGLRDFDIQFLGVEGGGKGFDIVEIIEQKKKAIYNVLASRNLITGESGGGSYNLLEGESSLQAHFVERDCMIIDEMWNKQVFPKLLRLNGWEYKESDLPQWKHGQVQPVSIEEFSKGIQRCAAFIPVVPETVNQILAGIGMTYEVDENMSTEDLKEIMSGIESGAGKGNGTSGTGDTQAGGASSAVNSDNAA